MQKIITATGKSFQIAWLGASTIDMALRFAVEGEELQSILPVFISPDETKTLKHDFDRSITEYEGYTKLSGVNASMNGNIVVALAKGD